MRLFPALAVAALLLAGVACQSVPAYSPTDDLRPAIADLGERPRLTPESLAVNTGYIVC